MQNRNSTLFNHYIDLKKQASVYRSDNENQNERVLLAEKFKNLFSEFYKKQSFGLALSCIKEAIKIITPILMYRSNKLFSTALNLCLEYSNNAYELLRNHQDVFSSSVYTKELNQILVWRKNLIKFNPYIVTKNKFANERSIEKIQALVRSFVARKKFRIDSLPENEQTDYPTFVIGNDPVINFKPIHREPKEQIALIATSGMRAVSIACDLGNPQNIPKIFLIDNSKKVHQFWNKMFDFAGSDDLAGTKELFLKRLPEFLNSNQALFLEENICPFFKSLFLSHDYHYVRQVILNTSLIKQSWADEKTFIKLKNIISHLGIDKVYMYPSNIIDCLNNNNNLKEQLLKNIQLLNPLFCIYTHSNHNLIIDGSLKTRADKVLIDAGQEKIRNHIYLTNQIRDLLFLLLKKEMKVSEISKYFDFGEQNDVVNFYLPDANLALKESITYDRVKFKISDQQSGIFYMTKKPPIPAFDEKHLNQRYFNNKTAKQ